MNVHQTTDIDLVVAADLAAPSFFPLADIPAGAHVLESQATLAALDLSGVEGQLTLAPVGTEAGTVPDTILAQGPIFPVLGAVRDPLLTLAPDFMGHPGVLGVVLTTGTLPAGTRVRGALSVVYGAI